MKGTYSAFYTKCARNHRFGLSSFYLSFLLVHYHTFSKVKLFVCIVIFLMLFCKCNHCIILYIQYLWHVDSGFAPDCLQSGYFHSEHLWSSEVCFCEDESECQVKAQQIIYSPRTIVLWKFPVLPVSSYHPYFQLSVIESWLNIVNCIVNRTILFAPRQITIFHYRILIDHKSLIPSPPVIIKFIFNLIKKHVLNNNCCSYCKWFKNMLFKKLASSLKVQFCICPSKERWELWT